MNKRCTTALKTAAEAALRILLRAQSWFTGNGRSLPLPIPRKILVVETCALGDVLLSTPALRMLHELYPHAEVTVAVDQANAVLLSGNISIRDALPLAGLRSLAGWFNAIRQVRSERFDVAMNLGPSACNALLVWLARAATKIGYFERFRVFAGRKHPIPVTAVGIRIGKTFSYHGQHLIDRALEVVRALAHLAGDCIESETQFSADRDLCALPTLDLFIPDLIRSAAQQRYRSKGTGQPLVVIHPTASWSYKTWAPHRFETLLNAIRDTNPEARVVLIGSREDRVLLETIASASGCDPEIAAGASLIEIAALIECADVYVGADSGPMHIASSVGTPSVVIFGPSLPRESRPAGPRHRVLYREVECSPCDQTVCVRPDNPCTHLITVEEVAACVQEALAETACAFPA
jgi:ADP-heptose:LPS heptosyltransferase